MNSLSSKVKTKSQLGRPVLSWCPQESRFPTGTQYHTLPRLHPMQPYHLDGSSSRTCTSHNCVSTRTVGGKVMQFCPTTVQAQCSGGSKMAHLCQTTVQAQCSGGSTMTHFCPSTCSNGGKMTHFSPTTLQAQCSGGCTMTHLSNNNASTWWRQQQDDALQSNNSAKHKVEAAAR